MVSNLTIKHDREFSLDFDSHMEQWKKIFSWNSRISIHLIQEYNFALNLFNFYFVLFNILDLFSMTWAPNTKSRRASSPWYM